MMTNPSIPSNPSRNPKIKINSFHHYQAALDSLSLQNPPFPITPSSFPPCKHIPNTHFLVDSFRFPTASSTAHFLSHFHSDHYSGLSPCWSHGIVFCSSVTASLLTCILKVRNEFVFALPLYEIVGIDGCEVVLVDANHCPGAVQFLFRIPSKDFDSRFEIYVHTGDFRFCEEMKADPFLNSCIGCDAVFLDTTYCNKKFVFPLQEESVDYVVDVIERIGGEFNGLEKRVLFLVATYVIGKEKILVEVSQRCKRKVCVDRRKMEVLRVLGYGDGGVFTEDENESDVHVVGWNVLGETWPYFRPNFGNMKKIMDDKGYSRVVGFVPTGWTYEVKRNKFAVRTKDSFEIHLVPYSEHSNYDELREYVKFLRPKKVIPTVGVDIEKIDSKEAQKMKKHFAGLVDETANKEFLMGFHRASSKKVVNEGVEATLDIDEGVDGEGKEAKLSGMEALEDNDKGDGLNTFTLEELKSENVVAATPSEMHALEDNDIGVELNPFTLKETNSEDVVVASNEVMEKMIEELHQCLPSWVTRDQILTLIDNSKRNIVDAVSNFYECETEFYEQVADSLPSVSASQCGSIDDNDSISELVVSKSNHERTDSPLSKLFKLPVAKSAIKSGVSPGKRKRNVNSKPGKRGKTNTKSVTVGPKQSTITSFFNKRLPSAAKVEGVSEQCTVNENPRPKDDTISYTEEVDQFLRIIDGYESSRTYAVTLLERTKGDLNKALDLHYGNPESDRGENDGNLVVSVDANWNSVYLKSNVAEVAEPIGDTSVQTQSREAVDATLISLPPEKYKPLEHACWDVGQPAPYIHLARTFELVEAEKGKIKATSMICNMFRSLLALSPEDILPAVYLCTNKLGADHENLELNIGGSLVTSALEEACGTNRARLRELYNSLGDLGDVAQVCRQTQRLLAPPPPLLIRDVFSVLRKISVQTGSGSSAKKKSFIMRLMRSCREKEMKFIVRTLVRNLRIGAMMRTILPALAQAVVMNSFDKSGNNGKIENLKEKLQCISAAVVEAYNILPALDLIVPSLISKGIEFSASSLSMVPGIPIKPMLAKIANGASQALKVYQNKAFTCEYKYDGQRAQIHKLADGTIRIFSRNGDETTSRFPDLVQLIEEYCKPSVTTFIVDAEVVAVDRKNGCKLMSFQELSSRERGKRDSLTTVTNIKVEICVFVFDVMFANGKQLLVCPLRQRRQRLKELFNDERSGYFEYAKNMMVEADEACTSNGTTMTRMNAFLEEALQSSCEGIMVKSLDVDSSYSPSKRTDTWLKVKRDYVDGLNDSLDLVPIGAWHGNGRKAGWYSPFLVACYNPEGEEYQSVCRVMSGFSDAFYIEMKEFFSGDRILSKKPPYYRTAEVPDMWFSPELVWEIRGADFTVSPVHQAAVGLVHPARGISMRFPRFVSSITDRNPEDCSTAEDIAEMFNSQTRKMDVNAGT